MLNGQLDLRKQNVDISALVEAVLEELRHIQQSADITTVLNQTVNVLLNKGLYTTLTERRLTIASHVFFEAFSDVNLVERHYEVNVLQFTKEQALVESDELVSSLSVSHLFLGERRFIILFELVVNAVEINGRFGCLVFKDSLDDHLAQG